MFTMHPAVTQQLLQADRIDRQQQLELYALLPRRRRALLRTSRSWRFEHRQRRRRAPAARWI